MFWVILSVILLLILAALLYDFWYTFCNWISRIKIGSAIDDATWPERTKKVIIKWLTKGAPNVPVDEKKRGKLIHEINSVGKTTSVSFWQDASILKASSGMDDGYMQENVGELLNKYIDIFTGEWKDIPKRTDAAMLCYEFLNSPYIDNKTISPAMDSFAKYLMDLSKRHGTIPYNEKTADVRYVDAIGLICPFLIKYAVVYDKPEFIDVSMKQIKEYFEKGIHEKYNVPIHCFNKESGEPLGIYGWGRGCAWWALGLVDSLKALLEYKGRNNDKAFLLTKAISILDTMISFQNDDGSFSRMIFTDSLEDSSAGAILAYCYKYMYSLTQKENYKKASDKVLDHLKSCTRRNGVIDYSQGDTKGIGFYSDSLLVMPAAQGFAVATLCI